MLILKGFFLFYAVSETAVYSLVSLHLTQRKYQDIQFQLLQCYVKFHPDQLKNVCENDANMG